VLHIDARRGAAGLIAHVHPLTQHPDGHRGHPDMWLDTTSVKSDAPEHSTAEGHHHALIHRATREMDRHGYNSQSFALVGKAVMQKIHSIGEYAISATDQLGGCGGDLCWRECSG
jgi:hypothetical protein